MHSIDLENFRSIRGHVHAPLDAKVVLVHGENGAGKTSLLSAIELALTGQIDALRRADPNYEMQLLHKRKTNGYAEINVSLDHDLARYRADLTEQTISFEERLPVELTEFFVERAYLPQSLLGQLLQIYQEAGSDVDSPLARFVSNLLGLDRLDALEIGLSPLQDLRNVRRVINRWSIVENEISRLKTIIQDQFRTKEPIAEDLAAKRSNLVAIYAALEVEHDEKLPEEAAPTPDEIRIEDENRLAKVTDELRLLASIRRDISDSLDSDTHDIEVKLAEHVENTEEALRIWREAHEDIASDVRLRVEAIFPNVDFATDLVAFRNEAKRLLSAEQNQLNNRVQRARQEAKQLTDAREQLEVANAQLRTIDKEVSAIASNAGALSTIFAEISNFIVDDNCPVCGRDYAELEEGSLREHVHNRALALSSSAERLILLGRSRNDHKDSIDRLVQTIDGLESSQVHMEVLARMDRRAGAITLTLRLLEEVGPRLEDGQQLIEANVAAQRALANVRLRSSRRLAIRENLNDLARSAEISYEGQSDTIEALASRIELTLTKTRDHTSKRVRSWAEARGIIHDIRNSKERISVIDSTIAEYEFQLKDYESALQRGKNLRTEGRRIRNAVDEVRSAIIRREFNDRLNKLWRDLFLRLAPSEEFVPAFRIPQSETRRLQPKLYTPHRDLGDEGAGGTPGAMLSAGNLNTAALTLFVALHLSVSVQLPWLILDDPVQSMDDIHIAHFSSLLRTLSKEHARQVIIAVHDRQLFEYLRLELSPAFADDSLITLELTRSSIRDTQCISNRYSFQEETALRIA
nr:AAA family ATPase [Flavimaribacter sediminis]